MPTLAFPTDRIVGTVDWIGSWSDDQGPVLATGLLEVPDGVTVGLEVQAVRGTEPTGGGSWSIDVAPDAVDLGFLLDLPSNCIDSLTLHGCLEDTFDAVGHLAPGLRSLYLVWADFGDAVLETVAGLTGLTYLQTFGNDFSDHGVQQLDALVNLEHLYLEEATLTAAAFDFVGRLPQLARLGLQDVPITADELSRLRERLPGVDVG